MRKVHSDFPIDQNLLCLCSPLDFLVRRQHGLFVSEINLVKIRRRLQFSRFERGLQPREQSGGFLYGNDAGVQSEDGLVAAVEVKSVEGELEAWGSASGDDNTGKKQ